MVVPLRPNPTRVVREQDKPVDPPSMMSLLPSVIERERVLELPGDRGQYTWNDVPIGHYVPGSGIVIEKKLEGNGVLYVTFERLSPRNASTWVSGHHPRDRVPMALTNLGLVYWR